MSVEIGMIPEDIIEALEGRGLTAHDIENATPDELFIQYTEWVGFRGYGKQLIGALDTLRYAKKC